MVNYFPPVACATKNSNFYTVLVPIYECHCHCQHMRASGDWLGYPQGVCVCVCMCMQLHVKVYIVVAMEQLHMRTNSMRTAIYL